MGNSGYYTAQICMRGHVITSIADSNPESLQNYCEKCGSETIKECPTCSNEIKGSSRKPTLVLNYSPPSFCPECGEAYPWTESRIEGAKELIEVAEELSEKDKELVKDYIDQIAEDTQKADSAAIKFKKKLSDVAGPIRDRLYDYAMDLASETIKKMIEES